MGEQVRTDPANPPIEHLEEAVSLSGRLDELRFAEVVNLISWGKKTGKLVLTRADAEGIVVFRSGNIIYAASNAVREVLGSILLCRGLVTEEELIAALAAQHRGKEERRLGSILVEMGALAQNTLEEVVSEQTKKVLLEFFQWNSGFFRFHPIEIPERGEIEVDAQNLLLERGLRAESVLLEAVGRMAEADEDESEASVPAQERSPSAGDLAAHTDLSSSRSGLATLGALMTEVEPAALTGELTLKIMRAAAAVVRRALLVIPENRGFQGVAGHGLGAPAEADARVRAILIPYQGASVFAEVRAQRATWRGKLERNHWNSYLIKALGGTPPTESVAVPAVVQERVFAILYGDNAPSASPVGAVANLEVAMREVALSLVRAHVRRHGVDPFPPSTSR